MLGICIHMLGEWIPSHASHLLSFIRVHTRAPGLWSTIFSHLALARPVRAALLPLAMRRWTVDFSALAIWPWPCRKAMWVFCFLFWGGSWGLGFFEDLDFMILCKDLLVGIYKDFWGLVGDYRRILGGFGGLMGISWWYSDVFWGYSGDTSGKITINHGDL